MQIRVFEGVGATLPDAIYNAWRAVQDTGVILPVAGVITDLVSPSQSHDGYYHYVITAPWGDERRRDMDAFGLFRDLLSDRRDRR
ncbi:MAG: hypothetical protein HC828_07655 [Blastochloris sp.]|nr:hypothetical protein [Blastochloris sp.]